MHGAGQGDYGVTIEVRRMKVDSDPVFACAALVGGFAQGDGMSLICGVVMPAETGSGEPAEGVEDWEEALTPGAVGGEGGSARQLPAQGIPERIAMPDRAATVSIVHCATIKQQ